jgi:hypothetical protein
MGEKDRVPVYLHCTLGSGRVFTGVVVGVPGNGIADIVNTDRIHVRSSRDGAPGRRAQDSYRESKKTDLPHFFHFVSPSYADFNLFPDASCL